MRDPAGSVHGVCTLLSRDDADKLDRQEGGSYDIVVCPAKVYSTDEDRGEARCQEPTSTRSSRGRAQHAIAMCSSEVLRRMS